MAAADRELQQVTTSFEKIKKPNGFYHFVRLFIAGVADALDIEGSIEMTVEVAAAPATAGAGLVAAAIRWVFDVAKDLAIDLILALSEIPLNRNKKKLNKFSNLIITVVQAGQQRIDSLSAVLTARQSELQQLGGVVQQQRQYAAAQVSGTVVPIRQWRAPRDQQMQSKQIAGKMRSLGARMSKSRIVLKSQWLRKIGGYIADFIPWIEFWPWRTLNIWKGHKQYKEAYKQIVEDHKECVAFKRQEPKILSELERAIEATVRDIESVNQELSKAA